MSQYEPMYDSFSHAGRGGYVPTPRMSVSSSVYLPGSDVDLQTGWLKPDRQRRCRTQGKRLEIERLRQEEAALQASIQRELFDLEGDYKLLPGHGGATTLEHERRYNPYMKLAADQW